MRQSVHLVEGGAVVRKNRPDIAVAISGRIAGISYTVPTFTNAAYNIVVAPQMFRVGANTVEIYEVSGTITHPILRRIQGIM